MPIFIVNTISTFHFRYAIEAESLEHAYDAVTMRGCGKPEEDFNEFSQNWLGETIVDGREIKKKDFDKLIKEDKNCCHWMGETLIHKIDYSK
jgi:hypothetical protein